ncbi:MAG: guanylate kinase [[Eubacterium] sulci]|jgi:guanylate kinase|nr:guanylate kinase [[Eubacterium] sulci]MBF1162604.1 guanylate kinase [[Eubacterium] sulci]MBF1176915.1 guanylate kinase [[Eubacterium] sulci]MBF1182321.1 guanylate kinase [[Eubacterium] sulci]
MEGFGNKGKLFVLSGPSGVGKGTICKKLLENIDLEISVSATTRKPREGEIEGVSYFFVNHDRFEDMIQKGEFLEHAEVFGNYYGTPKQKVLDKLTWGKDVLLEIDVQGAMQVKGNYPESITIFVCPPSLATLKHRLAGRGTESEESLNQRIAKALTEIEMLKNYDYYIVNDELDDAVKNVKSIIYAEHHRIDEIADEIIAKYREEE